MNSCSKFGWLKHVKIHAYGKNWNRLMKMAIQKSMFKIWRLWESSRILRLIA